MRMFTVVQTGRSYHRDNFVQQCTVKQRSHERHALFIIDRDISVWNPGYSSMRTIGQIGSSKTVASEANMLGLVIWA